MSTASSSDESKAAAKASTPQHGSPSKKGTTPDERPRKRKRGALYVHEEAEEAEDAAPTEHASQATMSSFTLAVKKAVQARTPYQEFLMQLMKQLARTHSDLLTFTRANVKFASQRRRLGPVQQDLVEMRFALMFAMGKTKIDDDLAREVNFVMDDLSVHELTEGGEVSSRY